ncbi:flavo protein NADH-dependent oxidoreductase [Ephemerocybe angulata]|uniref:Flavo protein NADH-dependent oxidoreductase n=1 Tax=Ephemerocybe angulata TaxID=980116 RepID=A0A8H6IF58_9AGAR|nr:flavo protein NADH-dependent oxidoreductase [Tulosesus angulatus]
MATSNISGAKALFTPLKLGDITIPNRVMMTALTRNRTSNTVPSDLMTKYYAQRAQGGAGLIVAEGILISRQGTEWQNAPGIWSSEQIAGWKKITDAVHASGSFIYAQLWHVGRLSHPDAPQQKLAGVPVPAPSAIAARGGTFRFLPGAPGYVTPTEIEDPALFVKLFKDAAINAKEAGFDGVELHGAGGYLVQQFLDNTSNKRGDKWGGSVENRSRFGLEVLKALISVFGKNVAIKLSPAVGFNDVGMPLQETLETFRYFIAEADKLGLSYITLMRYSPMMDVTLEDGTSRATQHDVLESYRSSIKHTSLFLNVGLTPEEGAKLIEEGKIDGAGYGIPWIAHPDFALRVKHGKPADTQPNWQLMQIGEGDLAEKWGAGYTDYPALTEY